MSRFTQLSAAIAVALGINLSATQAAPIEFKPDGVGDALLFPTYIGFFDNWITLQNNGNGWLQGHLRFRGAAWGGEVLSFDVILSPGDVMVFRLADLDADGQWEIDQSLDPRNFQYSSQDSVCDDGRVPDCTEASHSLEPRPGVVSDAIIAQQRNLGYIEFIGECELRNMNAFKMTALLTAGSDLAAAGMHQNSRSTVGTKFGTNCWAWSDAANQFEFDTNGPGRTYGLGDFPNVVSGNAFIRLPGQTMGLAYNAEAFADFRTAEHPHRVDSYRILSDGTHLDTGDIEATQRNRAVILHDPDPDAPGGQGTPFGHYIYRFAENISNDNPVENRRDEALTSFLTTYGPTLADGDDYDLTGNFETLISGESRNVYHQSGALRPTSPDDPTKDDWDVFRTNFEVGPGTAGDGSINSIGEVEEAIRIGGQTFTGFYVDNANAFGSGNPLSTWYFGLFPTKIFYAENPAVLSTAAGQAFSDYQNVLINNFFVNKATFVDIGISDIFENYRINTPSLNLSPLPLSPPPESDIIVGTVVSVFVPSIFSFGSGTFANGRVVIHMHFNDPFINSSTSGFILSPQDNFDPLNPVLKNSWPGLFYAFDTDPAFNEWGHWRRLQRCHSNGRSDYYATDRYYSCQENN